jgi:hypothetical protein
MNFVVMNDKEVIISALQRERDELHERIMQVDRILNKIKSIEDIDETAISGRLNVVPIVRDKPQPISQAKTTNIKLVLLNVFDMIGKACVMKDVQKEYENISGNKYNVREPMRTLQRARKLVLIKEAGTLRGYLWAKTEWIENNRLKEEHKPEGFDALYSHDNLVFE